MKRAILLLCAVFNFYVFFASAETTAFYFYDDLEKEDLASPTIIHMMFFPWDKDQHFLEDELQFDHGPYAEMASKARATPNARVVMWTHSKAKEFCLKHYPEIWNLLEAFATRPVMYVDVLRWLVVYHYGGIYWQYDSLHLASLMEEYLPRGADKKIRLFIADVIDLECSKNMRSIPIRKGQPEEFIRVAPQVFSCNEAKNATIKDALCFFLHRLQTERVSCDYDVLYITGDAGISEYYDKHAQYDPSVELVPLDQTQKMIDWNSKGRWRTDRARKISRSS